MKRLIVQISDEMAAQFGIVYHDGWTSPFTRQQAARALYANGTRIAKCKSEKGDRVADGALGVVLGSIYEPRAFPFCGYFIEWDTAKKHAVFVVEPKLMKAPS